MWNKVCTWHQPCLHLFHPHFPMLWGKFWWWLLNTLDWINIPFPSFKASEEMQEPIFITDQTSPENRRWDLPLNLLWSSSLGSVQGQPRCENVDAWMHVCSCGLLSPDWNASLNSDSASCSPRWGMERWRMYRNHWHLCGWNLAYCAKVRVTSIIFPTFPNGPVHHWNVAPWRNANLGVFCLFVCF